MLICNQYGCQGEIEEDAIDHKCFKCGDIFCIDHIDDYPVGCIKDARKRIEDIRLMDIDEEYLEELEDELDIAEEAYDDEEDELIIFSAIQFPICECCSEKLSEQNEKWKKITKKKD